ncbi:WD40/YVTN/BNR-like repeat-containing protein [Catenovulum sediminis]|uniref:WD40/YVTN/BNR-like repeat-containing protein n=1 Tax=Catenovulum sediminis TaxID=1740262 RepID=UPI00117F61E3|nr:sialidase [Catenovulum sediminis]
MRIVVWFIILAVCGHSYAHSSELLLLDILVTENQEQRIVAIGERGHVVHLDNAHATQKRDVVGVEPMLTAITQSPSGRLWAVGHQSIIVYSDDSGRSWHKSYQPNNLNPLLDVEFIDDNHGIAIGAYGLFYRTRDAGRNWTQEYHIGLLPEEDQAYLLEIKEASEADYLFELSAILPHLNQLKRVGSNLYLVGELGLFAVSYDNGRSWQRIEIPYYGSLYEIAYAQQQLFIGGMRGSIFRFAHIDGQISGRGEKISISEPVNINKILLFGSNNWLIVGNSQSVWVLAKDNREATVQYKVKSKVITSAVVTQDRENILVTGERGVEIISLQKLSQE